MYAEVHNSQGDLIAILRGACEIMDDGLGLAKIVTPEVTVFLYDSHLEIHS